MRKYPLDDDDGGNEWRSPRGGSVHCDEGEGESEWRSPRGGSVHCDDDAQGLGASSALRWQLLCESL